MKKLLLFTLVGIFILFVGIFSYFYILKKEIFKAEAEVITGLEEMSEGESENLILPGEQVLGERIR